MFTFKQTRTFFWAVFNTNNEQITSEVFFADKVKANDWFRTWMSSFPSDTKFKIELD